MPENMRRGVKELLQAAKKRWGQEQASADKSSFAK
jgi:hypothetical protein